MRNARSLANLKPGGAPGGVQPGSGRPPKEFRAICASITCSEDFFNFARAAFRDEKVSEKLRPDGSTVKVSCSPMEKKAIWEALAGYGYGKPIQPVELEEGTKVSLAQLVAQARMVRQTPEDKEKFQKW